MLHQLLIGPYAKDKHNSAWCLTMLTNCLFKGPWNTNWTLGYKFLWLILTATSCHHGILGMTRKRNCKHGHKLWLHFPIKTEPPEILQSQVIEVFCDSQQRKVTSLKCLNAVGSATTMDNSNTMQFSSLRRFYRWPRALRRHPCVILKPNITRSNDKAIVHDSLRRENTNAARLMSH